MTGISNNRLIHKRDQGVPSQQEEHQGCKFTVGEEMGKMSCRDMEGVVERGNEERARREV